MFDFDRLYELSKKHGVSKAHLCSLVGKNGSYVSDLRRIKRDPPPDAIEAWAEALHTTPVYLLGKTDKKNKPTAEAMDFEWFINLSPENKAKVMERAQVLLEEQEQKK